MELQIFKNAELGSVRSTMINGEPYFVGKDVAEILGYADPNKSIAIQKQQLIEMQLKASYYDVVLNSPDLVSITEISKDYGWSTQRMNDYLHTKGVQFKQGGRIWILYQKHAEKGYTSTKTHTYPATDGTIHTKVHTYWTQKGRLFIYDLLKADGILPIIEQED